MHPLETEIRNRNPVGEDVVSEWLVDAEEQRVELPQETLDTRLAKDEVILDPAQHPPSAPIRVRLHFIQHRFRPRQPHEDSLVVGRSLRQGPPVFDVFSKKYDKENTHQIVHPLDVADSWVSQRPDVQTPFQPRHNRWVVK